VHYCCCYCDFTISSLYFIKVFIYSAIQLQVCNKLQCSVCACEFALASVKKKVIISCVLPARGLSNNNNNNNNNNNKNNNGQENTYSGVECYMVKMLHEISWEDSCLVDKITE